MNFGKPRLTIREPKRSTAGSKAVRLQSSHRLVTVQGEWWLWLWCSRWTLSIQGLDPVRSSASRRRILTELATSGSTTSPDCPALSYPFEAGPWLVRVDKTNGDLPCDDGNLGDFFLRLDGAPPHAFK
jgi:hypothetical protein